MNQNADDELFENDPAADYIYQSPATLPSWRSRGIGPAYIKIGRKILYRRSALDAFIASCEVQAGNRGAA